MPSARIIEIVQPLLLGAALAVFLRDVLMPAKRTVAHFAVLGLLACFWVSIWNDYVDMESLVLPWPIADVYWLIGPCLYIFLHRHVFPSYKPKYYLWHTLPFAFYIGITAINPVDGLVEWNSTVVAWNLVMLGYLAGCCRLLVMLTRYRRAHTAEGLRPAQTWLLLFLSGFVALILTDIVIGFQCIIWGWDSVAPEFWDLFSTVRLGYVLLLVVYLHFVDMGGVTQGMESVATADTATASSRARLTPSSAKALAALVRQVLQDRSFYTDPEVNLRMLAERIGITNHELSEVLNRSIGCTFYELINQSRIHYARELLEQTDRSVIDVAFDCGYGNKSTFYRAFKKITGTSPSAYRAEVLNPPVVVEHAEES